MLQGGPCGPAGQTALSPVALAPGAAPGCALILLKRPKYLMPSVAVGTPPSPSLVTWALALVHRSVQCNDNQLKYALSSLG